ncbi:DUF3667 domain-containing protein [Sphingomonas lutea]|uniref:DUF3667 domain-containing protein n=1 Tax=Sphingomonas lutea TaxID=1045317 RepID=A0A7G9SJL8_9SPHN|nr:DUF3667 domain-containing protein [Sphingomonas lutea]QNN68043.1 DUF3667 domain-containing protein [Sphingomonas lutea]
MGEMEGLGEAVTGGLLARAVEPGGGEARDDGHTHERNCLNCGTRLTGPYCTACGQKAHVHRSLRAFMQDFAAGLFNFEGKFWRTLPMLVWRPGEMTRRYIAGERARFISPIALYLFTVFAMFATLNFTGALDPGTRDDFKREIQAEIAEEQQALAKAEAARRTIAGKDQDTTAIETRIAQIRQEIADKQAEADSGGLVVTDGDEEEQIPSWLRPLIDGTRENPQLMAQKIQDAASKYSWLLIPISVPFLWLLFPLRRRYKMYDHTVFVTYSLSFMMILVVISGLLVSAGMTALASFLFFVPPIHMYRHLKGAYQLGRWSALLRTAALVTFACICASLFLVASVAIGTM